MALPPCLFVLGPGAGARTRDQSGTLRIKPPSGLLPHSGTAAGLDPATNPDRAKTILPHRDAADRKQTDRPTDIHQALPPFATRVSGTKRQRRVRKVNDMLPPPPPTASPPFQREGRGLNSSIKRVAMVEPLPTAATPTALQSAALLRASLFPAQARSGCRLTRYPGTGARSSPREAFVNHAEPKDRASSARVSQ